MTKTTPRKPRKPRKPRTALPPRIYVLQEHDSSGAYLVAARDSTDLDDGAVVGIYDLVHTRMVKVTRTLQEPKP